LGNGKGNQQMLVKFLIEKQEWGALFISDPKYKEVNFMELKSAYSHKRG
jgi:hypothetical protein